MENKRSGIMSVESENYLSLRLSMESWMNFITALSCYGGKIKWAIFGDNVEIQKFYSLAKVLNINEA